MARQFITGCASEPNSKRKLPKGIRRHFLNIDGGMLQCKYCPAVFGWCSDRESFEYHILKKCPEIPQDVVLSEHPTGKECT